MMNREQWEIKRGEHVEIPVQRTAWPMQSVNQKGPPPTPAANCSHYEALSCCEWVNLEKVGDGDTAGR